MHMGSIRALRAGSAAGPPPPAASPALQAGLSAPTTTTQCKHTRTKFDKIKEAGILNQWASRVGGQSVVPHLGCTAPRAVMARGGETSHADSHGGRRRRRGPGESWTSATICTSTPTAADSEAGYVSSTCRQEKSRPLSAHEPKLRDCETARDRATGGRRVAGTIIS